MTSLRSRAALLALVSVGLSGPLGAQDAKPLFEVVSIKPRMDAAGLPIARIETFPGGRFQATYATVADLIVYAYELRFIGSFQSPVTGGPGWATTERFDIDARWAQDGPLADTPGPVRVMLQNLLAERFKLAIHRDTRQEDGYALVLARPDGSLGPAVRRSELDCRGLLARYQAAAAEDRARLKERMSACSASTINGQTRLHGRTMAEFAMHLGLLLRSPVRDETGLEGTFDIEFTAAPVLAPEQRARAEAAGGAPSGLPLDVVLVEEVGVKLDPGQVAIDIIVIDRVERPTEN